MRSATSSHFVSLSSGTADPHLVTARMLITCVQPVFPAPVTRWPVYDLCDHWPVTSVTCDLCDLWPLWPVTFVTFDLCDLWPLTCRVTARPRWTCRRWRRPSYRTRGRRWASPAGSTTRSVWSSTSCCCRFSTASPTSTSRSVKTTLLNIATMEGSQSPINRMKLCVFWWETRVLEGLKRRVSDGAVMILDWHSRSFVGMLCSVLSIYILRYDSLDGVGCPVQDYKSQ